MTPIAQISLSGPHQTCPKFREDDLHWFAVAGFLEDLGRHVPRRTASGREHVELLLVHYARKPKVRDEQICVVFRCAEEQVLGFQVAVDDAVVVEVGDGREDRADEVGGVGFEVRSLSTDAIEEFAAESEVGD